MIKLKCVSTGSKGNCYFFQDDDRYLCLDCGSHIKWNEVLKGCDFQTGCVDGLILSHVHADHLPKVSKFHGLGIPVVGNKETKQYVRETQNTYVYAISEMKKFKLDLWEIIPWYVPHTGNDGIPCKCYAYYIKSPSGHKLVYITDFMYSPVKFGKMNVDSILVAANHDDDIDGGDNESKFRHVIMGHSNLSTVKELIKVNQTDNLRNVILCHLSSENATPSKMQSEVQEVVGNSVTVNIAQDGHEYILER